MALVLGVGMKRLVLASLSVLTLGAISTAQAADMPKKMYTKAPVMVVPPSWTGWYLGVNAGYGFGSNNNTFNFVPNLVPAEPFDNVGYRDKLNGFIGGGQIGYNYQITPNSWVAGVEADIQYTDFRGSASATGNLVSALGIRAGLANPWLYNQDQKVNWLSTVRARLGWTPGDHTWLFYATGGLAVGGVKASDSLVFGNGVSWTGSASETKVGWTIGGGAEARLTDNWTAKIEYLYYDLGHLTVNGTANNIVTAVTTTTDFAFHGNIVRVGLNKQFTSN
jgi:outer membrane immunogenic protein